MIIQFPIRSAYVGSNDGRKAGVKDAAGLISNKLLRLGIILLGFKLNLAVLFTQGIKCLPIAAVVVTLPSSCAMPSPANSVSTRCSPS